MNGMLVEGNASDVRDTGDTSDTSDTSEGEFMGAARGPATGEIGVISAIINGRAAALAFATIAEGSACASGRGPA